MPKKKGVVRARAAPVLGLLRHVFAELLNNAIDHRSGTHVVLSPRRTPPLAQWLVSDNGCGIFDRLGRSFAIEDAAHALLELTKGRLTTDPQRHTGRGLFYTPLRAADALDLRANPIAWQPHDARRVGDAGLCSPGREPGGPGVTVP